MRYIYVGASVAALSTMISSSALAESAGPNSLISEIIVTGTRVTGLKAADSAAPIQVLGAEALRRVGQPDLIQALAQNRARPSPPRPFGGDTGQPDAVGPAARPQPQRHPGAGQRQAPPLHRQPRTCWAAPTRARATADLDLIPVAAIDHVEVLQDGAAAQYGTDAIAGVVNIILKNQRQRRHRPRSPAASTTRAAARPATSPPTSACRSARTAS